MYIYVSVVCIWLRVSTLSIQRFLDNTCNKYCDVIGHTVNLFTVKAENSRHALVASLKKL